MGSFALWLLSPSVEREALWVKKGQEFAQGQRARQVILQLSMKMDGFRGNDATLARHPPHSAQGHRLPNGSELRAGAPIPGTLVFLQVTGVGQTVTVT